MADGASPEIGTRRERARADTVREIRETARRVLVTSGPEGLALRAIAREMGLSAPALYRYFPSREDLVEQLVADLYDELSDHLEAARDAVRPPRPGAQLLAAARAFRHWATTHHAEFGLLFGSAAQGVVSGDVAEGPAELAGRRFGGVFAALMAQVYLEQPFPVPADGELTPELQEQLEAWCAKLPVALPLGVMSVFLSCWIRLYGMVCMEVFGHLRFALADPEPMFESEMRRVASELGIVEDCSPPS
ncbi:TetR/AcrR family transcriptional regulator [Blastococcus sp. TF02A-26]|uniref:TetR/AcrR family transcriptional regulator n=1 Tax=Blastococcus sp. TF02A-26 TaxID=2250577 RepID=UPI0018F70005|nr:TetR/AcrR family transcriptional regulator [Blastococcus sp. TF02A-26]